ncbi:preprotein translocase subunit YajC [Brachyspira pilosicoli]|uniref:Sec translocon accessory complex subunit YajC n=3 Tax=Brachyspira pilosicoli TaxID=52584 RepID=D8IEE4_BRAP9|nr:preprotein translocase subunit YajC [Brachyspira pilosicoli]ADK31517.1 preprotein translocase, YajC subunit [Brachyspira pilosicoli 95/1000]AGA66736.1 preprotein translocase subunit YajC [Brachyspira pilosicoli P43/6/78]MBW5377725.1 preprotein translocase subunit YajC [Brachyspira pilosicoli]MBW5383373.1 preprotein translocase subunit YajC [Brachyspira pilosicoli]MBW5391889.1 preprotein translocase subunit YajC [Brachyspira pilosicoli]
MFTATLYAQTTGGAQAGGSPLVSIGMMVAIFAIFYFLLIRPQKKQQQKLAQSIASLKKGDKIIVAGGIVAEYVSDKEGGRVAIVKLGENTKIEIIKSSISAVVSEEVLNNKKEEKKDKKAIEDKNQIKEELEKAQSEEKKE